MTWFNRKIYKHFYIISWAPSRALGCTPCRWPWSVESADVVLISRSLRPRTHIHEASVVSTFFSRWSVTVGLASASTDTAPSRSRQATAGLRVSAGCWYRLLPNPVRCADNREMAWMWVFRKAQLISICMAGKNLGFLEKVFRFLSFLKDFF